MPVYNGMVLDIQIPHYCVLNITLGRQMFSPAFSSNRSLVDLFWQKELGHDIQALSRDELSCHGHHLITGLIFTKKQTMRREQNE